VVNKHVVQNIIILNLCALRFMHHETSVWFLLCYCTCKRKKKWNSHYCICRTLDE